MDCLTCPVRPFGFYSENWPTLVLQKTIFAFICLWFKKSKAKALYQIPSDDFNTIMKINLPSTSHYFKKRNSYAFVNSAQCTHERPLTSPWMVGSVTRGGSVLRGPTSCIFKESHKCWNNRVFLERQARASGDSGREDTSLGCHPSQFCIRNVSQACDILLNHFPKTWVS